MARGQQKIQAQMKNAERQAKLKKAQKSGINQKEQGKKALKITCPVSRIKEYTFSTFRSFSQIFRRSVAKRGTVFTAPIFFFISFTAG